MITDRPSAPIPAAIPDGRVSPGAAGPGAIWVDGGPVSDLPEGALRRVSHGELDLLTAHTPAGIVVVDDRCPHMAAPLSIGTLTDCVVACPLHEGRFDLCSGEPVQMPTTGGLDPDGTYHPTWTPGGKDPKVDPPGKKAEARRLTRVRRLRYYPVRLREGRIEISVPG
jgi:nitrite reductase/ring-hydroxylating ferredoxin subunit